MDINEWEDQQGPVGVDDDDWDLDLVGILYIPCILYDNIIQRV